MRKFAACFRAVVVVLFAWPGSTAAAADAMPLSKLSRQTHFHGLAVDPKDPTRLFLATHHGFFVVGGDGMATLVSPVQDFMGFTPHPGDSHTLYASGHPAGGGNLGFIVSTDGGATWTQLSPGLDGPVDFHQMDVSPVDPNVIYGAYGNIQVSRDGGKNWTRAGPAPEGLIQLSASHLAAERLYAATRVGLLRSDDGGGSWQEAGFDTEIVSMVRSAPGGRLYAYVVGRGLLAGDESGLADWTLLSDLGGRVIIHFAIDRSDANRQYAVSYEGEVLASADGGRSWRPFGAP